MIQCLLHGITKWSNCQLITFLLEETSPDDEAFFFLKYAFQDQSTIGWNYLLHGRLSINWSRAHSAYVTSHKLLAQFYTSVTMPKLIRSLWNFSLQTWTNRNNFKFRRDLIERNDIMESNLNDEVKLYFNQKDLTHQCHHNLLYKLPVEKLFLQSNTFKHNWIYMHQVFQQH